MKKMKIEEQENRKTKIKNIFSSSVRQFFEERERERNEKRKARERERERERERNLP